MIAKWYINNIDMYAEYNVGILADGINDLFMFPSLKQPYFMSWPERDGIEVDLTNPKLDNKNVTLNFASEDRNNAQIERFLTAITEPGYHNLQIRSLEKTFKLRVSNESNRIVYNNGQTFSIQFVDDFPRDLINSTSIKQGHGISSLPASLYKLDGVGFEQYGLIVHKGKASVYSIPTIKLTLERNISTLDGRLYDADFVRFSEKDVVLNCSFYCDTIIRFWQNYSAFFNDLIKPNERKLYIGYTQQEFKCYYKHAGNFKFQKKRGYVLCQFDLTLVFTDFRPKQ